MGAPGARAPPRPSTAAPRSSPRGCAHTPRKKARAAEGAGPGTAGRGRGPLGAQPARWAGAAGRHVACLGAGKPGWLGRARDFAISLDRRSYGGPRHVRGGRVQPPNARGPGLPRGRDFAAPGPRLGRDPLTSGGPRTSEPLGVTLAPCGACSGDSVGLLSVSSRANSKLLAEDSCLELSWVCLLLTNKTQLVHCDLSPAGTFRSRVSGRVSPVSLMNSS